MRGREAERQAEGRPLDRRMSGGGKRQSAFDENERSSFDDEDSGSAKMSFAQFTKKALTYNGQWDKDSFDDYPVFVYWIRQVVGLVAGLMCGVMPITDPSGFAVFAILNIFVPFFVYGVYSNVNIDDFGGFELVSEGMQQSAGVFALAWILTYSALHF